MNYMCYQVNLLCRATAGAQAYIVCSGLHTMQAYTLCSVYVVLLRGLPTTVDKTVLPLEYTNAIIV